MKKKIVDKLNFLVILKMYLQTNGLSPSSNANGVLKTESACKLDFYQLIKHRKVKHF